MDPDIWKNLPDDLIIKIIKDSKPSIDTLLEFKIKPGPVTIPPGLDRPRVGLIYNETTKSLHNFRLHDFHVIRRPVDLIIQDNDLKIFYSEYSYNVEIICSNGSFMSLVTGEPWFTELYLNIVTDSP